MSRFSELRVIKSIEEGDDWYSLYFEDGMCTGFKKKYGIVPKIMDQVKITTVDGPLGGICAMEIQGVKAFDFSDEELEAKRQKWLKENDERKVAKFLDNEKKMDAQYKALPKPFQERIDRFRANNENFRVDYESYELFCCEEAVKIAEALKTSDEVKRVSQLDFNETNEAIPNLSDDHSGNTIGCAFMLAFWYLEQPENVIKMHGALSPLVGSKAYGDVAKVENL